ncbi:conserved hypothetical protein [Thermotomaculum hydrothermale]|uniref:Uncharacterized protein n=1 Tax=Thermotomaculum hydrothermale TaxID=981385 RepID=A0A7R6SXR5_9BACT|nr:hypothetical protein [Thermotomaculum hydrothermale]BBB31771.1 conserved hypothetical protein [Thermotomaculum hydrothermale]
MKHKKNLKPVRKNMFSCYVEKERFLGQPTKDLADFVACKKGSLRKTLILSLASLLESVDHINDFDCFRASGKLDEFLRMLELSKEDSITLKFLILAFFEKHSENSSGIEIPQDDVISLRKGRLFEEILYRIGPVKRGDVDLLSMHCQPMLNREVLEIKCGRDTVTGKNLDVVFWGKDYIEGYECKSCVNYFIDLGKSHAEKGKKVREKIRYLNQLAKTLKNYFKEVHIILASFSPEEDLKRQIPLLRQWVSECDGDSTLYFKVMGIEKIIDCIDKKSF